ncbi:DNA helicase [Tsukamurella pulmonis]|uniref:RNA polymerase recycling motor ATPase HelR n=1 Tax=Tsukamurella pulmonis TaxID=47312 RepID=UPI001EDE9500|nr:RNA polymerase recycling motor ATPase HelR [Tsukamurella pulmonis]BDD84762.1 DNA helicase [Tsukamurella pulmonis]
MSENENELTDELMQERAYVAGLYARLDAERARARRRYSDALRDHEGRAVDREGDVMTSAREMRRLDVAEEGLAFGRLDGEPGGTVGTRYVGRLGLFDDEDGERELLLDWRAPASRPFYTATGAHPEGVHRRRQFHSRGREVTAFTDEMLGRPGADARGDAALLAAVTAPRGAGMRDIVATIQADQDRIIRSDDPGVTVIEGGPGTGKTVVALHRVAYLLYTQRARFERHGVLVVGPNTSFLRHIDRVLPSLGESDVVFATPGTLYPGVAAHAEDAPAVARIKGSAAMAGVLAAAVADASRLPEAPVTIGLGDTDVRITADVVGWARDEARESGRPHNQARSVFLDVLTWAITERALGRVGKQWLRREDTRAWEEMRGSMLADLAVDGTFRRTVDALWPVLSPERLLADLLGSPERLAAAGADPSLLRSDGAAWTVSDVPLLDELAELLGPHEAADDAAAAENRREQAEFAEGVLDSLVSRSDSMDDEDHLFATDLLYADDLAGRFEERDTRDLVERAAADRTWVYRHVVVDEAQELSAMDWRVLMRRCPSRSFTVVGDLTQRSAPAGARSWAEMLDPYVAGRWAYTALTVNYRTPSEIMDVAAELLARFAPGTVPPESVRASGTRPWARRVGDEEEIAGAIADFVRDEAGREGTSVVIGTDGTPGAVPPAETKGLEFDAVLVVDPEVILADGERGAAELYVALTRATQRLGVLHREPLPESLSGLADPAPAR